jgi:hypothetical protein
MVPPVHMQMLYAKAAARNNRCLFVEFPTGMHMDTWLAGGDHYWKTIQEFLEQTVSEKKPDESSHRGKDFKSSKVLFLLYISFAVLSPKLMVLLDGLIIAIYCLPKLVVSWKRNLMNLPIGVRISSKVILLLYNAFPVISPKLVAFFVKLSHKF